MLLLSITLSILIIIFLKWIIQRRAFFMKLKALPEPKNTLPIIGNALDLLSPVVIIPNLLKLREECGKLFKLMIGPMATFVISTDPNFAEFVLSSPKLIEKSADYEFMTNWLGQGLITAPGNIWIKHRKILTPAFHFQILEKMVDQFAYVSNVLIKQLNGNINVELDIYPFITRCTLDVICETSMGVSFNAQEENNSKFVAATRQILQIINNRMYSAIKQSNKLYMFTLDYWREQRVVRYLHKVTDNIIRMRKRELESKKSLASHENEDDFGNKKRKALLNVLLDFDLNDEEIRNEVNTFLFAGHDTTASGISFALYLLSNHPDIQNKLFEEIVSTLGSDPRVDPNYNQLQKMKYLEMVIKEALRLYPPVPLVARRVSEDVVYNGTVIPKGARISIFIYAMHREADAFDNPETFDPERFSTDNQSKRSTFSYLPFSAGQRNCIGQKFAMLSMKSIICKIVRNFELLPVSHRKPIVSVETILKSQNGIYVKLRKRNMNI